MNYGDEEEQVPQKRLSEDHVLSPEKEEHII